MNTSRQRDVQRQLARRRERRAAGVCVECGKPSGGSYRCEDCRSVRAAERRYERALIQLAREVMPFLREAEHFEDDACVPLGEVRRLLKEIDRTSS